MKKIASKIILIISLLLPGLVFSQNRTWEFGVLGGIAYNVETPLQIYQNGETKIKINARYKTEPFKMPVYYDIRFTTWQANKGWAVKFTHHKIILTNRPVSVQRFSITDGFNLLTANRLWHLAGFDWSLGGGLVITHPESTIRNQAFPENGGLFKDGYYISGPTMEAAIAKRFYITDRWLALAEGRITGSYVRVPVVNGHANVTSTALHLLAGLGYKLKL